MTVLIAARGLSVELDRRRVLDDIALEVAAGELVAIIGPNGAGKTTLLRALAGLTRGKGEIEVGGTRLKKLGLAERARRLAYLPQGHVFYWPLPVSEVVGLGRLPRGRGSGLSVADKDAVAGAMAATGVTEYAERPVTQLSGGERARVALARVLATEAPVILADEPTASLDPRYQIIVLDILRRHAEKGGAVVAVLHDLGLATRHADRIIVLDKGRIVAAGPPAGVLTHRLLESTFGVRAEILERRGTPVIIPWSLST